MKRLWSQWIRKLEKEVNVLFLKKENAAVKKMLVQLNPKGNKDKLYRDYQKKKLKIMGLTIFVGLVSALSLHLSSRMGTKLSDGAQLIRNEWGAGDYKVILRAKAGEWSQRVSFLVQERKYTREEKEELSKQLYRILPELIKGENQDLQHVTSDLELISSIEGYPFRLSWDSEKPERIGRNGRVKREGIPSKGEWVTLKAEITDEEIKRDSVELQVFVIPENLSPREEFFRALENTLLSLESLEGDKKEIRLPQSLFGIKIDWEEQEEGDSIFVFLLFLTGSVLAGRGMDQDLKRSSKKRSRFLTLEYADFVSRLRLYLSAGLTVRNAFIRMTKDYAGQKKAKGKGYLYEEMKASCHQLENGVAEEQVYQQWGQRCGEMRYRRLSFLLASYLRQGNDQLLQMLAQEADSAEEDRKNLARKAGEEAGTKLLLPMVMMMMVIMLLVLLPAYLNFGSI